MSSNRRNNSLLKSVYDIHPEYLEKAQETIIEELYFKTNIASSEMNNNRRNSSSSIDEELESLDVRIDELQNLFMNDEIALKELIARTAKYYFEFPLIGIEIKVNDN